MISHRSVPLPLERLKIQTDKKTVYLQGVLQHHEVTFLYKLPYFGLPSDINAIDLAGLEDIDSAGLALLLEWWRDCKYRESTLSFQNMKPEFFKLLALYDLGFLVE